MEYSSNSKTAMSSPSDALSFLSLTLEVRYVVYRHAISLSGTLNPKISFADKTLLDKLQAVPSVRVMKEVDTNHKTTIRSLLLSCRSISRELFQAMHAQYTFHFGELFLEFRNVRSQDFSHVITTLGSKHLSLIQRCSVVADVWLAESVDQYWTEDGQDMVSITPGLDSCLPGGLQGLLDLLPGLKHLTLGLRVIHYDHEFVEPENYAAHLLAALEPAEQLENFSLYVYQVLRGYGIEVESWYDATSFECVQTILKQKVGLLESWPSFNTASILV